MKRRITPTIITFFLISAPVFATVPAHAALRSNTAFASGAEGLARISMEIKRSIDANANREGFVKGLLYTTEQQMGPNYNVMVFNLSVNHSADLKGAAYYGTFTHEGSSTHYGVWAFEDGVFTNLGDGGFINWAFSGNWERQNPNGTPDPKGGRVSFRKISVPVQPQPSVPVQPQPSVPAQPQPSVPAQPQPSVPAAEEEEEASVPEEEEAEEEVSVAEEEEAEEEVSVAEEEEAEEEVSVAEEESDAITATSPPSQPGSGNTVPASVAQDPPAKEMKKASPKEAPKPGLKGATNKRRKA